MRMRDSQVAALVLLIVAVIWLRVPAQVNAQQPVPAAKEDSVTSHQAKGPFDVKIVPFKSDGIDAAFSAMTLDKQFHGALEATSKGTMLAFGSPAKGSGGYVAIELVDGALDGRKGTFVLQHNATMDHGTAAMNIIVVPGSGTGELTGITGKLSIDIAAGGKHSYTFDYTLPAAQ